MCQPHQSPGAIAGNAVLGFTRIINTFYIWHWFLACHFIIFFIINTSDQKGRNCKARLREVRVSVDVLYLILLIIGIGPIRQGRWTLLSRTTDLHSATRALSILIQFSQFKKDMKNSSTSGRNTWLPYYLRLSNVEKLGKSCCIWEFLILEQWLQLIWTAAVGFIPTAKMTTFIKTLPVQPVDTSV